MKQLGQIPEQIQRKQYDDSPMKDFLDAQFADFGGSAKEMNKSMSAVLDTSGGPKRADVVSMLKKGAAPSTNTRDYKRLPDALAVLGGYQAGKFGSVEEALKDTNVAQALESEGLANDFVENWHKTGKHQQGDAKGMQIALAAGRGIGKEENTLT